MKAKLVESQKRTNIMGNRVRNIEDRNQKANNDEDNNKVNNEFLKDG